MTKAQIIEYLQSQKEGFQKEYQLSKLALFGSYARDEAADDSDIDIAIETPLSDYFILYDLKEKLEKDLQAKVDLVRIRETMNPYLRQRIFKDAIYV